MRSMLAAAKVITVAAYDKERNNWKNTHKNRRQVNKIGAKKDARCLNIESYSGESSSCPNEIFSGLFLGGVRFWRHRVMCTAYSVYTVVRYNVWIELAMYIYSSLPSSPYNENDMRFVLMKYCCAFKCQLRRSACMIFLTVWQNILMWTDASQSSLLRYGLSS